MRRKKSKSPDAVFQKHLSDAIKEDPKFLPRYLKAVLNDAEKSNDFGVLRNGLEPAIKVLEEQG